MHLGARHCGAGATSQCPQLCTSEGASVATCLGRGQYPFLVLLVLLGIFCPDHHQPSVRIEKKPKTLLISAPADKLQVPIRVCPRPKLGCPFV